MIKTFEQYSLDTLLSHVTKEIAAPEKDIQAFQQAKDNIDKYITSTEHDEKKIFLDGFDYLESPIILDDFEEHHDRRQWFKDLEAYPFVRKRMQLNRLRVNRLSAINRIIAMPHFFFDDLSKPVPIISDRADEHINFLRDKYQDLSIEKQIEFTTQTASLARLFIQQMMK